MAREVIGVFLEVVPDPAADMTEEGGVGEGSGGRSVVEEVWHRRLVKASSKVPGVSAVGCDWAECIIATDDGDCCRDK